MSLQSSLSEHPPGRVLLSQGAGWGPRRVRAPLRLLRPGQSYLPPFREEGKLSPGLTKWAGDEGVGVCVCGVQKGLFVTFRNQHPASKAEGREAQREGRKGARRAAQGTAGEEGAGAGREGWRRSPEGAPGVRDGPGIRPVWPQGNGSSCVPPVIGPELQAQSQACGCPSAPVQHVSFQKGLQGVGSGRVCTGGPT